MNVKKLNFASPQVYFGFAHSSGDVMLELVHLVIRSHDTSMISGQPHETGL